MLSLFCKNTKDFNYYYSKADGKLPRAASYIADDFHEWWWSADEASDSRAKFSALSQNRSDALKYEISNYLSNFSLANARESISGAELSDLSEIIVDGIITTNWDTLIEELFPDYKVFIGQDELLFSNPQSIGEIYKIHGSASHPHSLILTEEDYSNFSEKNPYLAAKLVTVFVEHPIVFIGYSIEDPHIKSIIISIAKCLSTEKINIFQDNLIFIQYVDDASKQKIETTTIQFDGHSISMLTVYLYEYSELYSALKNKRRKLPARIIRFLKEQFYEFLKSPSESEKKIAVVDFDEIDSNQDVEFVVGVGVAKREEKYADILSQHIKASMTKKGYSGVSVDDIFTDFLLPTSKLQPDALLESTYPALSRTSSTFIPIYKYLRLANIDSMSILESSKYEGAKKIVKKLKAADYTTPSYISRYKREFLNLSSTQIIEKSSSTNEAVLMLGFQEKETIENNVVLNFIIQNRHSFKSEPYKTAYRKLVCLHDREKYGIS